MRILKTEKYYTCLDNLLDEYDKISGKLAFCAKTQEQFFCWQKKAREKLVEISRLNRMGNCELSPETLERVEFDTFIREKIIIQTEPKVWMPFYVLISKNIDKSKKNPCMIALHGHRSAGKESVAGRSEIPAVNQLIEKANYDYGFKFMQEGYITFCPDSRGFGERREYKKQGDEEELFINGSCSFLSRRALCLGKTLIGMWTWDNMRLIDYIINYRKDCDSERIGCAGLSGGGLQSLWLAALEQRISCAVVSGNFFGFRDSIISRVRCDCTYVPDLCEYFDVGDFGALVAPKPFFIESGTEDILSGPSGIGNVTPQVEVARSAYRLFDAENKLYHYIYEDRHMWDGKETYEFVKKHL